ncbi:hypothetical protein FSP39_014698 [Pinctada imbricata]|uniref:Uncharacterized protein n=1 Tax=Pinctada imbricata TaxID=66713 RepID=A0AA88XUS0_PINIB|nr:hypothetical protein FSP39_014698 [Pinctada imbricata]
MHIKLSKKGGDLKQYSVAASTANTKNKPCKNTEMTRTQQATQRLKRDKTLNINMESLVETTSNVRLAKSTCPHPCTQGGKKYCGHIPCPLPPCVDPVTPTGHCCDECPNGANCMIDGTIFPAYNDTIVAGKVCRCIHVGRFGSGTCQDLGTISVG